MAQAFIDTDTDTVYVQRGKGDFVVISPDGDPVTVFSLPGTASPLITEDEIDTEDAYNDGYDSGYSDGQDQGYSEYELEEEYERGFADGKAEAESESDDAP